MGRKYEIEKNGDEKRKMWGKKRLVICVVHWGFSRAVEIYQIEMSDKARSCHSGEGGRVCVCVNSAFFFFFGYFPKR